MGLFNALRFRVGLDATDVKKGLGDVRNEAKKTGKAMDESLGSPAATKNVKKLGQGTQALAQQLPDVISGFASGQKAMTIFSQQGLQVAQQTGLLQKGLQAVAAAGPLAGAAVGVVTAAAAAGGLAWLAYTQDAREAEAITEAVSDTTALLPSLQYDARDATLELARATGELTDEQYALEKTSLRIWGSYRDQVQQSVDKIAELRKEQGSILTQIVDKLEPAARLAWAPLATLIDAATTNSAEYEAQINAVTEAQNRNNDAVREKATAEREVAAIQERERRNREAEREAERRAREEAAAAREAEREAAKLKAEEARAAAEAAKAAEEEARRQREAEIAANRARLEGINLLADGARTASNIFFTLADQNAAQAAGLFKAGKAFAIGQALVSGYASAAAAITPPPIGYGPTPLGFAAAGGAIAFAAGQVISIKGTEMPTAHSGRMLAPDERVSGGVTTLTTEATLNSRATDALGSDNVNRLNDGRPMAPQVVVIPAYQHFDRQLIRTLRKPGKARDAFRRLLSTP